MIVDLRRVEARDGKAGKQPGEKPGAGIGEFVEGERAAGELGEDRKKARAGRGLQNKVGRRDRGGGRGAEAERDRRRKLLQGLALFGAPRMGREQPGHLGQHRQQGGGRSRPRLHRRPEFAQEQDGRRLAGLVGGFPVPGAGGIGSAEGRFHRRAEHAGIDALPALEMGKKPPGSAGDGGGRIGNGGERKGRGRWSGHGQEEDVMMGPRGERGWG